MASTFVAVITGDIIHSTDYQTESVLWHLRTSLNYVLQDLTVKSNFEISRGDSFQFLIPQAELALHKALELRAHLRTADVSANKYSTKRIHRLDARLAIGISNQDIKLKNTLGETSGEAFLLSGRSLDGMKKAKQNIVVNSTNDIFNTWLNVCLHVAEQSITAWTVEQATVILASLRGATQQAIAASAGISQAAVQQRLKKANWPAIKEILAAYSSAITHLHDAS